MLKTCFNKDMTLKCDRYAIYANYFMYMCDNYVTIYTSNELIAINNVTTSTGINIFHIIDICLRADMPATLHMNAPLHYYCRLHILHITAHVSKTSSPLCFEHNSNMHIYYLFGNHIYSLSSMTTYVFLAWQTYFISV